MTASTIEEGDFMREPINVLEKAECSTETDELRDRIAIAAMQGSIAARIDFDDHFHCAQAAYRMADAMLYVKNQTK